MNRHTYRRVLVLGMDGLDPRRVREMCARGELPAFERLRARGSLRALSTSNPAESPVAWSSLATGCNPGKHGIFDFLHRRPNGYVPFLSLTREADGKSASATGGRYLCPRRAPGFWRLTSDAGVPTTVLRWPLSFPAEPVHGRFLSGLGVPDIGGRLGKHTYFTTDPSAPEDEKVVRVSWSGDCIETGLAGSPVRGLFRVSAAQAALRITRCPMGVQLTTEEQSAELTPGQWSPWFRVRQLHRGRLVGHALVRFHLVSIKPELRLFATPLQIDPRAQRWPLTDPPAFGAELADAIGDFYTLGLPEDTHAVTDGRVDLDAFLHQCAQIDRERRAMYRHELQRFHDGAFACVFDAGDRVQHMFWSVDDPASPAFDAERARRYRNIVPELYRQMDQVLAEGLDAADDQTAVFVVSDHGFGPFHRAVHLNRWLVEHGYMALRRNGEGGNLFAHVDWSRTRAYALGFTSIYLNLAGRESHGCVEGADAADAVQSRIAAELRELRDRDGRRSVREVYRASELYHGPAAVDGPDLVVGFEPGWRASWQTALGGAPNGATIVDNDKLWAADHLVDPSAVPGVLATSIRCASQTPAGIDLAPTILDALGLESSTTMDGRSWFAENGRGKAPDVVREAVEEPAFAAAALTTSDGLDDGQRKELERHLSDLGYL